MTDSFKTIRHQLSVTLPNTVASGSSGDRLSSYAELVDETVDSLHEKCKSDHVLLGELAYAGSPADGCRLIGRHLKGATGPHPWLRAHAGEDLCRRVLYLLAPERFGFEISGWRH